MNITDKLASALNRRDEAPNIALAQEIVQANDKKAVADLVEHLHDKNKEIQSDCIKVLYEIANLNPSMTAAFTRQFIDLLGHKNNRLQWGAMTTLNALTLEDPKAIYAALPKIISAADNGSVITNDHCVGILIKLCTITTYADDAFTLLNERLKTCPTNQLPMYAEQALPIINDKNKTAFKTTLLSRLDEIEKESKRKRVEKVLKKV